MTPRNETAASLRQDHAAPADADTLPAWLYQRFAVIHGLPAWDVIADDVRAYWEHQARAVRRAVARGGFKIADGPERVDDCPGTGTD